jgi:hypothetical protein
VGLNNLGLGVSAGAARRPCGRRVNVGEPDDLGSDDAGAGETVQRLGRPSDHDEIGVQGAGDLGNGMGDLAVFGDEADGPARLAGTPLRLILRFIGDLLARRLEAEVLERHTERSCAGRCRAGQANAAQQVSEPSSPTTMARGPLLAAVSLS